MRGVETHLAGVTYLSEFSYLHVYANSLLVFLSLVIIVWISAHNYTGAALLNGIFSVPEFTS